jgi:hypothetical protein
VLGLPALPDQALGQVLLAGRPAGQLLLGGDDRRPRVLGRGGPHGGAQRADLRLEPAEPDGERPDVGEVAGALPLADVTVPGEEVLQDGRGRGAHAQRQTRAAVGPGVQAQPHAGRQAHGQRAVAPTHPAGS